MRRLLNNPAVEHALRGAALVVTDRRWAAPLSAAALGFGIFAGVAIGPGAAGTLATGVQRIIELPTAGGGERQSGGGGSGVASSGSASPLEGGEAPAVDETAPPSVPLTAEPAEPLPEASPEPAAKPAPAAGGDEKEDAEAETQRFEGTVVHANAAAGSYAMAIDGGELIAVHAAGLPPAGTMLSVPLRRLANGTFAEAGNPDEKRTQAMGATFRGTVSFVDPEPTAPAYTISSPGASLLVHVDPEADGAVPQLPALASYATVTAGFEDPPASAGTGPAPILRQRRIDVETGEPAGYLDLAGIVGAVLPDTRELLLSADDTRESGKDLAVAVPPQIDTAQIEVGDSYVATATVEEDGSLILAGLAGDERTNGADDATMAQGDLRR